MYGHGGDHCNRRAACMVCAGHHHTNECPLNNSEKMPAVFTCFNCKKYGRDRTDHSANDVNCPLRALYLERRINATSKNSRTNTKQYNTANRGQQSRFPNNYNNNNQNIVPNNNSSSAYASGGPSYSACLREYNDLFNIDEKFTIFTSTLNDLQKCTSKIEQIQVVMSMVRYAYDLR